MAEGNGKATNGDRRRYVEIARGSALECAAIQDVLPVCEALSADDNRKQKTGLDRLVAMLTKLGQRGDAVREELGEYRVGQFDTDTDSPANDTQADKLFNLFLQRYLVTARHPAWQTKLTSSDSAFPCTTRMPAACCSSRTCSATPMTPTRPG